MVAVINTSYSLLNTLNYNENKVSEKAAICIGASAYPKDVELLSFTQKLNRLKRLAELNEGTGRHSVHISLNFPQEDFPKPTKDLSKEEAEAVLQQQQEKLNEIAAAYMAKIGFGDQPYLVYQHLDAGHPHIHIVSVKIRPDGTRIPTQNIGKNESFKASRELEKAFGLTPAIGAGLQEKPGILPIAVEKVAYGRTPTKRAMTNVLTAILDKYKYSSLAELNAVLFLYNMVADPGQKASRTHQRKGLVYRLLNEKGEKVGIPIKASDFYNKPTLKKLEEKFSPQDASRDRDKRKLRNTIQLSLLNKPASMEQWILNLQKEGIHTVLRYAKTGSVFGITYVDHRSKSVFNGSSLGKAFSAKAILENFHLSPLQLFNPSFHQRSDEQKDWKPDQMEFIPLQVLSADEQIPEEFLLEDFIDTLFHVEYTNPNLPYALRAKKKRKKKK